MSGSVWPIKKTPKLWFPETCSMEVPQGPILGPLPMFNICDWSTPDCWHRQKNSMENTGDYWKTIHHGGQINATNLDTTSTTKRVKQNKFCDQRPACELIHSAACITQPLHSVCPLIQSFQRAQAQTRSQKTCLVSNTRYTFLPGFAI